MNPKSILFLILSFTAIDVSAQNQTNMLTLENLNSSENVIIAKDSLARFVCKLEGLKKGKSKVRIMHYGDSHIAMANLIDRLYDNLSAAFTSPKWKRWLHFSFKRPIVYLNKGVSGSQFQILLEKEADVLKDIEKAKPDLVIFSFGSNESYKGDFDSLAYAKEVTSFIQKIYMISTRTEILFTTCPDTRYKNQVPPNTLVINRILKQVATETNAALWDLNTIMGGFASNAQWVQEKLGHEDQLHFTVAGYQLQADLLFNALLK